MAFSNESGGGLEFCHYVQFFDWGILHDCVLVAVGVAFTRGLVSDIIRILLVPWISANLYHTFQFHPGYDLDGFIVMDYTIDHRRL